MEKPEIIFQSLDSLGEGPLYDGTNDELYWVDINNMRLHRYSQEKEDLTTFPVPGQISSIALGKQDLIYATMEHSIFSIRRDGKYAKVATIPLEPDERFNDGKAGPMGLYVAGTMDKNEKAPIGSLYTFNGKEFKKILSDMTTSNGLAWDLKRKVFYHIDSPRKMVNAYSYTEDMELKQLGVAADLRHENGVPDGMCISQDGVLFVAQWGGGKLSVWDPQTQKKLDEVIFPAKNITSCCFGGADNSHLFITSASQGPDDTFGGSLFRVGTDFKGGKQFRLRF